VVIVEIFFLPERKHIYSYIHEQSKLQKPFDEVVVLGEDLLRGRWKEERDRFEAVSPTTKLLIQKKKKRPDERE
jgi:hypothetical protein